MDSDNLFCTFLELAIKEGGRGGGWEVDFHEEMRNFNNLKMFENFQGLKWLVWILKSLYKL